MTQASLMPPRDPFASTAPAQPRVGPSCAADNGWPLTVATYNIHSAIGSDGVFDPDRIAAVLDEIGADIIALQEVPLGGTRQVDVLGLLRERTGFHSVSGPTMQCPERSYGNAILSRYRLLDSDRIDLSFGSREPRGAVDADIDCTGQMLRVVATHLGLKPAERRHQIRRLLQAFDTDREPVILMGCFR